MTIQPITTSYTTYNSCQKKSFNPVKITGYAALLGGSACIAAGAYKKMKIHKFLGYFAGISAITHTTLVWTHHKNK